MSSKTAEKYIIYRKGCVPFDLCSSQIFFYSPVVVKDSVSGNGFYSLQENIGGVDYCFQSSLMVYPNDKLIWRLEAWSVHTPTALPTWTTVFSLPWLDLSNQHLTVLDFTKDLLATVKIYNINGGLEISAGFQLPKTLKTPLRNYYLAVVGVGAGSSAIFQNLIAGITYNNNPDVTDMDAFAIPEKIGNLFPCNPSFNTSEGTNATQTLSLVLGNQINLTTDLTPRSFV